MTLKKISIAGTGLLMVLAGAAYVYRADIGLVVMAILIAPGHGFDDAPPPPAAAQSALHLPQASA